MVLKAKLTGDWSKARGILRDSAELKKAIDYAVVQEAHHAQREVIKGITAQAPGGKPFEPLAEITLALRKLRRFKGTKALLVTGGLRGSITVKRTGPGRVFLGVLRGARSKDGKDLVNIARVHEHGAVIVIRVTPKMRHFLMAQLGQSKLGQKESGGRDKGGRFKKWKFKSSGQGQIARGVIVIKIPARPYISPVIDKIASDPRALQKRFAERVAKKLRLRLGSA